MFARAHFPMSFADSLAREWLQCAVTMLDEQDCSNRRLACSILLFFLEVIRSFEVLGAILFAIANPMPRDAPVTSAVILLVSFI